MNDKKIDWWGSLSNDVKDYLILKYGYDDIEKIYYKETNYQLN